MACDEFMIEFETYVHETEDINKVIERVLKIFPFKNRIKKKKVPGSYKTEIIILSGKADKKDESKVISLLNKIDNKQILEPIKKRIEKNTLFLRINKQTMKFEDVDDCILIKIMSKNLENVAKSILG